jgi:hypothetical protein
MLALVAFGAAGLVAELLLLEHWESTWQWTPLVLLAATLVVATRAAVRPAAGVLRALRAIMALCVLAGLAGVLLHYQGNVEFELEREGALRGWALFAESVRGATPALAPGAMAQLGLLGLAATWRHPALRAASPGAPSVSSTTQGNSA